MSSGHQVSHMVFQVTAANFTRVISAPVNAPGGALSSIAAAAGELITCLKLYKHHKNINNSTYVVHFEC